MTNTSSRKRKSRFSVHPLNERGQGYLAGLIEGRRQNAEMLASVVDQRRALGFAEGFEAGKKHVRHVKYDVHVVPKWQKLFLIAFGAAFCAHLVFNLIAMLV